MRVGSNIGMRNVLLMATLFILGSLYCGAGQALPPPRSGCSTCTMLRGASLELDFDYLSAEFEGETIRGVLLRMSAKDGQGYYFRLNDAVTKSIALGTGENRPIWINKSSQGMAANAKCALAELVFILQSDDGELLYESVPIPCE